MRDRSPAANDSATATRAVIVITPALALFAMLIMGATAPSTQNGTEPNPSQYWWGLTSGAAYFCKRWGASHNLPNLRPTSVTIMPQEGHYRASCANDVGATADVSFSQLADTSIPNPTSVNILGSMVRVARDPKSPTVADALCALVTPLATYQRVAHAGSLYNVTCKAKPAAPVPLDWSAFDLDVRYGSQTAGRARSIADDRDGSAGWRTVMSMALKACGETLPDSTVRSVDMTLRRRDGYIAHCFGANRAASVSFSLAVPRNAASIAQSARAVGDLLIVDRNPRVPANADALCWLASIWSKSTKTSAQGNDRYSIGCLTNDGRPFQVNVTYRPGSP